MYIHLRERPFDFYVRGGGYKEDFLRKNNQDSAKDKQNKQDDQANNKNIQDGVKKDGQENVKRQMGTN